MALQNGNRAVIDNEGIEANLVPKNISIEKFILEK